MYYSVNSSPLSSGVWNVGGTEQVDYAVATERLLIGLLLVAVFWTYFGCLSNGLPQSIRLFTVLDDNECGTFYLERE